MVVVIEGILISGLYFKYFKWMGESEDENEIGGGGIEMMVEKGWSLF